MSAAPKFVAMAIGPSETGKTRAIEELFLHSQPRRISIDFQDEMHRFNPQVIRVYSLEEMRDALRRAAGYGRWHIALVTDPDRDADVFPQLARLLHPPRTSIDHQTFGECVGGIALDCTEADVLVPNGRTAPEVRSLFQRGRHSWLQLYMSTHAPALIDPRARDATDVFLAFRSQEDTIWKFWQRVTSASVADLVAELPPYHAAYIHKARQAIYVLDARRRVLRTLTYTGQVFTPPSSGSPLPVRSTARTSRADVIPLRA